MKAVLAAAAAVLAVAACGGSGPHRAPATSSAPRPPASAPPASPSAPGAAFCAALKASGTPQVTYADEVIRQVGLVSDGGSASQGDINAARAIVALWITISCPQFTYLAKGG